MQALTIGTALACDHVNAEAGAVDYIPIIPGQKSSWISWELYSVSTSDSDPGDSDFSDSGI